MRFRALLLVFALVISSAVLLAQTVEPEVLWNRFYRDTSNIPTLNNNYYSKDALLSVIKTNTGSYMCGGRTSKHMIRWSNGTINEGLVLMHFSSEGDSLWQRNLNNYVLTCCNSIPIRFAYGEDSSIFVTYIGYGATQGTLVSDTGLVIRKYTPDGHTQIWKKTDPARFITPISGLFHTVPDGFGGIQVIANNVVNGGPYIKWFNSEGELVFDTTYSSVAFPNIVERTADGGLFISGAWFGQIRATKINAFWEQEYLKIVVPSLSAATARGGLMQAPDGGYYMVGTTSPNRRFIARLDDDFNFVWADSTNYRSFYGYNYIHKVLADGGLVVYLTIVIQGANVTILRKYAADGSVVWEFPIRYTHPSWRPANEIYNITVEPNGDAVLVGYCNNCAGIFPSQPIQTGDDYWIAKIANFGVEYNPAKPTSVKERIRLPDKLVPYPNPSKEEFMFLSLPQPAELLLYSPQGKLIRSQVIKEGQKVDVRTLNPGIYIWQVRMGERVFTGKFIKE